MLCNHLVVDLIFYIQIATLICLAVGDLVLFGPKCTCCSMSPDTLWKKRLAKPREPQHALRRIADARNLVFRLRVYPY